MLEVELDRREEVLLQDEFGFRYVKSEIMVVPPGRVLKSLEFR